MREDPFNKLLPSYFRYIGLVLAATVLILSILIKVFSLESFSNVTSNFFSFIILLGFLFVLTSKTKYEDERINILRNYAISMGYFFLIGFIISREFNYSFDELKPDYGDILFILISLLGYQLILFELLKNTNFLELIEKNKLYLILSFLLLFGVFFWTCHWLWEI